MTSIGAHILKSHGSTLRSLQEALNAYPYATAFQIHMTPPRMAQLSPEAYAKAMDEAPLVKKYIQERNLQLFFHSPYVLNIAKSWPVDNTPYWVRALEHELSLADAMGARGCVVHLGKSVQLPPKEAEDNMLKTLEHIATYLKRNNLTSKLIIETSSGQGTELLSDISVLAGFYQRLSKTHKKYIQVCLDTCHVYAAGFAVTPDLLQTFDKLMGLEHLALVHLNNSTAPLGARKDRHASLPYGKIPLTDLDSFIQALPVSIPVILETPAIPLDLPFLHKMVSRSPGAPLPPVPKTVESKLTLLA